ncbi:MAG: sensor histidine kinase [Lawsonibacter sp.]
MEEQIDRMDRLVLEPLEQTRLERMEQLPRMEQVDLTGLIRTLLERTAPLFDGLTVRTELQEGCSLSGDRALLERAYGNLLSNAARYCTPGGQVQIQLERAPYAPVFTIWNHAGPIPETELPGCSSRSTGGHGQGPLRRMAWGWPSPGRSSRLHHLTIVSGKRAGMGCGSPCSRSSGIKTAGERRRPRPSSAAASPCLSKSPPARSSAACGRRNQVSPQSGLMV